MAQKVAKDVEKGEEGIEKEVDSLIVEIDRLSGLHGVCVSGRTQGVIKRLGERLGVDVSNYLFRGEVSRNVSVSVCGTNLPNKYNVFGHHHTPDGRLTGVMEELYYNLSSPEQIEQVTL